MGVGQDLDALDLDEKLSLYDNVRTKGFLKHEVTVFDGDRYLAFNTQSTLSQKARKHNLVYRFEKARP